MLGAHFAFGAVPGALGALARPLAAGAPTPAFGLLFGMVVWAAAYLGLMPALGLYPWPHQDRPARRRTMILAHAVYGLTFAEIERRLDEEAAGNPWRPRYTPGSIRGGG